MSCPALAFRSLKAFFKVISLGSKWCQSRTLMFSRVWMGLETPRVCEVVCKMPQTHVHLKRIKDTVWTYSISKTIPCFWKIGSNFLEMVLSKSLGLNSDGSAARAEVTNEKTPSTSSCVCPTTRWWWDIQPNDDPCANTAHSRPINPFLTSFTVLSDWIQHLGPGSKVRKVHYTIMIKEFLLSFLTPRRSEGKGRPSDRVMA